MLNALLEEKPFCTILAKKVEAYFQDEEHRRQFEEWYKKKYGKDYDGDIFMVDFDELSMLELHGVKSLSEKEIRNYPSLEQWLFLMEDDGC